MSFRGFTVFRDRLRTTKTPFFYFGLVSPPPKWALCSSPAFRWKWPLPAGEGPQHRLEGDLPSSSRRKTTLLGEESKRVLIAELFGKWNEMAYLCGWWYKKFGRECMMSDLSNVNILVRCDSPDAGSRLWMNGRRWPVSDDLRWS